MWRLRGNAKHFKGSSVDAVGHSLVDIKLPNNVQYFKINFCKAVKQLNNYLYQLVLGSTGSRGSRY